MARYETHVTFTVKLPFWTQARMAMLVALAKARFAIDVEAEAKAIVDAARIKTR